MDTDTDTDLDTEEVVSSQRVAAAAAAGSSFLPLLNSTQREPLQPLRQQVGPDGLGVVLGDAHVVLPMEEQHSRDASSNHINELQPLHNTTQHNTTQPLPPLPLPLLLTLISSTVCLPSSWVTSTRLLEVLAHQPSPPLWHESYVIIIAVHHHSRYTIIASHHTSIHAMQYSTVNV